MRRDTFPVVDAGGLTGDLEARTRFGHALGEAFRAYGFVTLSNHGISRALREQAYAAVRAFFALPERDKLRYHLPGGGGERGYTPFRVETAKGQRDPDLKEFWHVGREQPPGTTPHSRLVPNLWPHEVPEFQGSMLALYAALDDLGTRILGALALHLGLPERWFDDKIDHGNSVLRALHYPPLEGEPRGVRAAAHEDINLITLLIGSGEPGLEILRRDGTWLPIETRDDQIVVNVGDMLQRLTNHVLPSTTHRVVNPPAPWGTRSRYSLPFFLHFNPEFVISTLPSCMGPELPNRYPEPIRADDYLQERLREIGLA